jgi:DnaJ-domain-containing protein 1
MADPFAALGLAPACRVEPEAVRQAQRRVMARWHPDRFPDAAERADAQRRVAEANEAAAVLLDPLACAQAAIDALAPVPRPADPRPDPAFLAEMLELREALDAGDAVRVRPALDALEAEAHHDLAGAFEALQAGSVATWSRAVQALGRLRAVRRARESAGA